MPDKVIDAPIPTDLKAQYALCREATNGKYIFSLEECKAVIERIARLEAEKQAAHTEGWISVEDRMPEYDLDVHLWAEDWDHTYVGYWRHSEEWIGRFRPETQSGLPTTNPTHWHPFPAKPTAAKPEPSPSSANRAEGRQG